MSCNKNNRVRSAAIARRSSRRRGFSLAELMIVIAIIGLLATTVTISVRGYMTRAKQSKATTDVAALAKALDSFYSITGRYPTQEEGLDALLKQDEKSGEPFIKGSIPLDPWGNKYEYIYVSSNNAEVVCRGADGKEGGTGADSDISSSDLSK